MDQLVLDLSPEPLPAFESFLAERNSEVVNALVADSGERFIYLWGESGCGKTHLLKAWIAHAEACGRASIYLDAASGEALPDFAREASFIAVDHLDLLDPNDQITLFSIYNTLRETGEGRLLMAGPLPPSLMAVRDDLRSRLGWGLVLEVKALSDEDKLAALARHAESRQLAVPEDVFRYLLSHWRRDLASLTGMLDLLDRYSLAVHRPITVPLLKTLLQTTP